MKYELRETVLCLNNVEVGYGEGSEYKPILKNINIIEKNVVRDCDATGQVIAIVGRSGRGKSTLFKVIAGLKEPHSGQVLIAELNGNEPDDAKIVKEGDVGFVDQKYTLFRHKTVEQILSYALRKSKMSKEEKKDKINNYLSQWGLEKHQHKYPCELSGGQRQRAAIIEQIFSSGHFMVLDEPTSGLDLINVDDVKRTFELIRDSHELNTIIFSTHNIDFAIEMADSIYVVGFPDETQEWATIVKHYDLKAMGLAWQEFGIKHLELSKEIKEVFRNS